MKKKFKTLHWTAQTTLLFLLKHMLTGMLGGFFFGGLFLYYDINGLWSIISTSSDKWLAIIMMFSGLALTFGSIGMGWGIFSLAQERDEPPSNLTYY
jgi:hypothetical protein